MAKSKKETIQHENKEKALELAVLSLEKKFGKGTVISGDRDSFPDISRIPSGSISLDKALGGGYASGRIIEIIGMESAGKTSLSLHAIAECQKQGKRCAFIDAEHALDTEYAKNLGVNTKELLISQPSSGEESLNIVEAFARSNAVSLIVVDSVAALVPQAEIEGDIGDNRPGAQARLMSQAMRMLVGPCHETNTAVIFLNQIRSKIGIMFGNPEVGCGGNALKFYASQRLDIRRIATLKEGEEKTGIRTRVKVVKNKTASPFKMAEFNIIFGKGIDWAGELLDLCVAKGIIDKSGSWYSYNNERLGQGTNNVSSIIHKEEELTKELKDKLLGEKSE